MGKSIPVTSAQHERRILETDSHCPEGNVIHCKILVQRELFIELDASKVALELCFDSFQQI